MESPPKSILILGHGVFGLSTALSLSLRPSFANSKITVLDRSPFPSPDGSSIDSSRIIRSDYSDPAYAKLGAEAMEIWRSSSSSPSSLQTRVGQVLAGLGEEGQYTESGLALVCDQGQRGESYVRHSFENMKYMSSTQKVKELKSRQEIKKVIGTGGVIGDWGYINTSSGWADAEAGMRFLHSKVEGLRRVQFLQGEASSLIFSLSSSSSKTKIEGIKLTNGSEIKADLVILATGAWTGKLVDLRGRATATGQALCYLPISREEQEKLSKAPVILNMSTGMFIIPPPSPSSSTTTPTLLKVARHGYGYTNPTPIPIPNFNNSNKTAIISLPKTTHDDPNIQVPLEGQQACRLALSQIIPSLATRAFTHSKICWYTDTPSGEFLITYHPRYTGLFLATGGSGHGYKFLPVIGERIVDVLEGKGKGVEEFGIKWGWGEDVPGMEEEVVATEDGSRGGRKGMVLGVEMGRGESKL